jgi:hypothetical protein
VIVIFQVLYADAGRSLCCDWTLRDARIRDLRVARDPNIVPFGVYMETIGQLPERQVKVTIPMNLNSSSLQIHQRQMVYELGQAFRSH